MTLIQKFFYRSLDYIAKNKDEILRNLNAKICANTNRKIDVLWFDATTTYFETFSREGYKNLAIQKMENLKKPDCYRYGNWWKWDTVTLQNISRKCYWFKYFLPFMLEIADIYEVNSVTIIADKGMVLIEILIFRI